MMDGKTEELAAVRVDPPDPGIGRIHTHIQTHTLCALYNTCASSNPKIKHNVSIILYYYIALWLLNLPACNVAAVCNIT